jgi:hypothetical protein
VKRLAVFVEGYTEVLFLKNLISQIILRKKVSIRAIRILGGTNTPRRTEVLVADGTDTEAEYYVLIVDCTGDETVKTRILEEHESLTKGGYSLIIGIRDVFPQFSANEIPRLEQGLRTHVRTSLTPVIFILAVMEVEAWFLAEHTHFAKLKPPLTAAEIQQNLGFNPEKDDMALRAEPASDLNSCYALRGETYKKGDENGPISMLNYDEIYLETQSRFTHLSRLIASIDSFFS